jgi:hypothetical protein
LCEIVLSFHPSDWRPYVRPTYLRVACEVLSCNLAGPAAAWTPNDFPVFFRAKAAKEEIIVLKHDFPIMIVSDRQLLLRTL